MVKGNAGLIALCVLLGGAAFAVLFVAPRYFDGDEMVPPKVVAEAGKAAGPDDTPDAGDAPAADAAKVEDDTAEGDAEAERADIVADESGSEEQTAETATTDGGDDAPSEVAESPDGAASEDTETAVPDVSEEETAAAEETDDAPAAGEAEAVVPAFDVLRVEPDGSMVVAGRAEPGSKVEIVDGDDVLASTEAGPAGNFAAVLDEPLAPGDYQIALRASDEDGASVHSEETATVSVPSGDDDELLALVTRPGEASRIVAAPEADEGGEATGEDAAAIAEGADAAATAPASEDAAATADEVGTDAQVAAKSETAAADAEESAAPAADEEPAAASTEDEAKPAEEGTEQSVVAAGDQSAADAKADRPVAGDVAPEDGTEAAALGEAGPDAGPLATKDAAKGDRPSTEAVENVRIDAVEVEGDELYVTGSAEPGATVAIYVDNVFAGSAEVNDEGRFLVEERMPMTVGEHTIRADMTVGGEVVARAIVPFTRPDEGTAAAVARVDRPEDDGGVPAETDSDELSAETDPAEPPATADEADPPVDEASREPAESPSEPAEVANGSSETAEQPAVEPSPPMPETGETGAPPADADEGTPDAPELAAREEIEETEPTPSPSEGQAATLPSAEAPAATPPSEGLVTTSPPAEAPAATPPSAEGPAATPLPTEEPAAVPPAAAEGDAETIVTLRQEPLEPTDSSVIIRRGDTLWEISRRVYGQGVRYTTIYLANDEQIGNPDLILPGQVFSVPDESLDNAEELHRRRVLGLDG